MGKYEADFPDGVLHPLSERHHKYRYFETLRPVCSVWFYVVFYYHTALMLFIEYDVELLVVCL